MLMMLARLLGFGTGLLMAGYQEVTDAHVMMLAWFWSRVRLMLMMVLMMLARLLVFG